MPKHRSWSKKINQQNKSRFPVGPATSWGNEYNDTPEEKEQRRQEKDRKNRNGDIHYRLTCDRFGPTRTLATSEQLEIEQLRRANLELQLAGLEIDIESPPSALSLLDKKISEQEPFDLEILWPALLQ